jgi:hypothetical protein
MEERIGEIIEAATGGFTVQSYELYKLPALGSLVKTRLETGGGQAIDIYGIVYNAATTGIEPGRRPIARGKDEATEDGIYASSPQLMKLLKSEFSALVAGYKKDSKVRRYLPPQTARLHGFVYQCSIDEVREFSRSLSFLNILTTARVEIPVEELIAAAIRNMAEVQDDRRAFLVAAGKELATLLCGQYQQLRVLLGRLQE